MALRKLVYIYHAEFEISWVVQVPLNVDRWTNMTKIIDGYQTI
jgi:hypothetical protein